MRLGRHGHVVHRPAEAEQAQGQGRSAGSASRIGPAAAAGDWPPRWKIERMRAVAYCRYGPVFPVRASSRSKSRT